MKRWGVRFLIAGLFAMTAEAHAQSLWDRRDPQFAYLFQDTRARNVGDLLTIVVSESTESEGTDTKELEKKTSFAAAIALKMKYAAGSVLSRNFNGDADSQGSSQRKFEGKAISNIDRRFIDRMTVTVIGVLPNGNLILEGHRTRVVTNEMRTLRVRGVVRPIDIGPYNTVQSQFIADFVVSYDGRGPESSYTNHGWLGKIVNKIWPF